MALVTRRGLLAGTAGLSIRRKRRQRMAMYPDVTGDQFFVVITSGGAGSGVFVYSPSFAVGNLIASMTASSTGPLGETVQPGITTYQEVAGSPGLTTQLINGIINFLDQQANDPVTRSGAAGTVHVAAGIRPVTFVDAPSSNASQLHATMWLLGANPAGSGGQYETAAVFFNASAINNFAVVIAGVLSLATIVGGLAVQQNTMSLGPANEFTFDHDILSGTAGSIAKLVRYSQDTAGYPVITDAAGFALNMSGCQPASGNKLTVTAITFGSLGFGTIPANEAEANAVYEYECGGYGTQATGSTVALTLQARFGASPGAATDVVGVAFASTPGSPGDALQWSAKVRAQCLTSGAAATWRIFVTGVITDTVTGTSVSFATGTGPTDITQDSTAAINMGLSAKWASTTGAPTITKSGHQPGRRG